MRKKLEILRNETKAEIYRRGLTHRDIADRYGCSYSRINGLLIQSYVSEDVAQRLADAIGVPVTKITREIQR